MKQWELAMRNLIQTSMGNSKTRMLTTRMLGHTCPGVCPFDKDGCYGQCGRIPMAIRALASATGPDGRTIHSLDTFSHLLQSKPRYTPLRWADFGDLPHRNERIRRSFALKLARSAAHLQGIAFTHHLVQGATQTAIANRNTIRWVNRIPAKTGLGLVVNLSANGLRHADALAREHIGPIVAVVPRGTPIKGRTPAGHRHVRCFQQTGRVESCADCLICARVKRPFIVTFEAHGVQAKRIEHALSRWEFVNNGVTQ